MTREEALAYALRKKAGLESEINKSNCEYGKWVMYSAALDFINAAISALKGPTREQVEKMRGEWIGIPNMGYTTLRAQSADIPQELDFGVLIFAPTAARP